MGFLNLILKAGYDGSAAEAGLRSLDKKVVEQSLRTQARIKANLLKAFVVGGTATVLSRFFGDARQQAELASANDITIAQLSMLEVMAARAGKSFEQYRHEIEKTGESVAMFASKHQHGALQELEQSGSEGFNSIRGIGSLMWKALKLTSLPGLIGINRLTNEDLGADKSFPAFREASKAIERLRKTAEDNAEKDRKAMGPNPAYMSRAGIDYDTLHNVMLETSRNRLNPDVNDLQQVGLMGVNQNSIVDIQREQVQVLRHIDGTLEKISQDSRLDPSKVDFGR